MANKTFLPAHSYGKNRVYMEFTFTLNGASNPAISSLVGVGPTDVTSFTHTSTGVITVQLADTFPHVVFAAAALDDTANDGAYASVANVANEGSSTTGISFHITTRAAGGVLTDYSARLCRVTLAFKNRADSI